MALDKAKFREIVKAGITAGIAALAKLAKTKLLPKATERYVELVHKYAEKLLDKVGDLIEKVNDSSSTKIRIKRLFLLKLCLTNMDAIANLFIATADRIREEVDFSILEDESKAEKVKVALADIPGATEEGGCGPDGCEIA